MTSDDSVPHKTVLLTTNDFTTNGTNTNGIEIFSNYFEVRLFVSMAVITVLQGRRMYENRVLHYFTCRIFNNSEKYYNI